MESSSRICIAKACGANMLLHRYRIRIYQGYVIQLSFVSIVPNPAVCIPKLPHFAKDKFPCSSYDLCSVSATACSSAAYTSTLAVVREANCNASFACCDDEA